MLRTNLLDRARITVAIIALLATSLSGPAAAQGFQDFFGVPHDSVTIGKLKADNGSITCAQINSKSAGPCAAGSGSCGSIGYSCANAGGTTGNGSGTMEISFNFSSGPVGGVAPDCYPLVGSYAATGKRDAFQEITGFAAVACDPLTGEVAQIVGGWQLVDWANFVPGISNGAGGTLTGTMNVSTGALKLVLKGKTF